MWIDSFILKARDIYGPEFIPLHRPIFEGNEKSYLIDCIDSNFVSSVGAKVTEFEEKIARFTGARYAVATVNGTAALHVALELAGVESEDEVLTQALTFVATCNAISYVGACPIFVDVDLDTMGMSPDALRKFLDSYAEKKNGHAINKISGKRIKACVPMHTFGSPCRIEEISYICSDWGIALIEDAAESLGSYVGQSHTGTFGNMGTLSFNGNKLITTGAGGMIITDDAELAVRAKHITTTAKVPHPFEFVHDEIAYNYRMPNLNAALGCAQMERLEEFLIVKAKVANKWEEFFECQSITFSKGIEGSKPNYWLNAIVLESKSNRDEFLEYTNANGVMTRPIWKLMCELDMFKDCQTDGLKNSLWLQDRVVNVPSSVPDGGLTKWEGK
jgi:aminotransferase in exopolysaccharide biosynthesis